MDIDENLINGLEESVLRGGNFSARGFSAIQRNLIQYSSAESSDVIRLIFYNLF